MSINTLLSFIRQKEAQGDYNVVWNGIGRADRPKRPLVEMTVGEVLDWQDSIDHKYRSEAAGAYQILEDTLRGLYRSAGVPLTAKFNAETQDRLAIALLRRRGLDDYLAGRIDTAAFANSLAKEWASLPVVSGPKRGLSYYHGDGLNATRVPVDSFLKAVEAVHGSAEPRPDPRDSALQSTTVQASATQVAAGVGAAATGVAALDGTAQIIVVVAAVIVIGLALYIMRERLKKWGRGVT